MRYVLVTGGAGYIGSHICKLLAAEGITPVTVDNLSRGHEQLVKWGPLEDGDISEIDWVRNLIQRYSPEAVIHCAAYTSVSESVDNPAFYYSNNLIGTLSLLNAMVAENALSLIFSSSCSVHGEPLHLPIMEDDPCQPVHPYGRSKLMMEQVIADYCRAYGMRAVMLRYFNAAGSDPEGETGELHDPETHLIPLAIRAAVRGEPFRLYGNDYDTPDGTAVRDYIHVSDLAEAHYLCLHHLKSHSGSLIMNVGTGHGHSVQQVLAAVESISGKKIRVEVQGRRAGDVPELVADTSRIQSVLRWMPTQSSLQNMVATEYAWHIAQKNLAS